MELKYLYKPVRRPTNALKYATVETGEARN
jgi:hypothetical protein